jgi:hypothetical protein
LTEAFKNPATQKIAWDITWDNLNAEHLLTQQDRAAIKEKGVLSAGLRSKFFPEDQCFPLGT